MEKKSRMTRQKRVILDILRGTNTHPTADWIYEQAKKKVPELSLGTVYRNLNVLKENGEIAELNFGSSYSRFDGNPALHYHFSCDKCQRIFDLEMPLQEKIAQLVQQANGHQILSHRLEFYGVCKDCQRIN